MSIPVQTSSKQHRAALYFLAEEIHPQTTYLCLCSCQCSTRIHSPQTPPHTIKKLLTFAAERDANTEQPECRSVLFRSVQGPPGLTAEPKATQNLVLLSVFVFLPPYWLARSLSPLPLCWKGYPGSLAPQLDSLAAVGCVSVNNTYILHISAECSPAHVPRLNY